MFRPTIWRFDANPFRELQSLQRDMNRIFSNMADSSAMREYPAINAWSGDDSIIVTAELPGIDPDKLNVSVQNSTLILTGSRDFEILKEGEAYHRQERSYGQFTRTLKLPFGVDAEKVEASYKKGILTITLHRMEEEKPKKIVIKAE
jgi:HSP20 family protein